MMDLKKILFLKILLSLSSMIRTLLWLWTLKSTQSSEMSSNWKRSPSASQRPKRMPAHSYSTLNRWSQRLQCKLAASNSSRKTQSSLWKWENNSSMSTESRLRSMVAMTVLWPLCRHSRALQNWTSSWKAQWWRSYRLVNQYQCMIMDNLNPLITRRRWVIIFYSTLRIINLSSKQWV